ncbi:MAG TPA: BatA domain-containing protein [Candidatus Binataceae bacterium]|nr:BatA domain-containing protein [Candidatus Binataceae bacterium]
MGFLNPHSLVYGLSIAALIVIYLRSRSRPTIEVSSLMLFEEAPAPVASVRHVRIDPLFWFELAGLAALTLAAGGLYLMTAHATGPARSRALVFDLGAAMAARESGGTRIDQARRAAYEVIDEAPAAAEFSVIAYALEAELVLAQTSDRAALRKAIGALGAIDVPARASALRAAMMRAQGAAGIDLFTDRPPPAGAFDDVAGLAPVRVHRVGQGDDNAAIVSLDPGAVGSSQGRAVLRNFSDSPRLVEFAIDLSGREVFHRAVMMSRREQVVVPFGPLRAGGLVHAQILSTDSLMADNERWAWAPASDKARALVVSPDPAVRDDLARVLLALNANFRVDAADPALYRPEAPAPGEPAASYALAVMHDCYLPAVHSDATLLVFPPLAAALPGGLKVIATAPAAEMRLSGRDGESAVAPTMLGATRIVKIPEWMEAAATASRSGSPSPIVAAGTGRATAGNIGLAAFDVRDHLLLDPDRLDALVVTIGLMRKLVAPGAVQIVSTGGYVDVPASGTVQVTGPEGSVSTLAADRWGRVRLKPLKSGRYTIASGPRTVEVYANYFDASQSDLSIAHPVRGNAAAPAAARIQAAREPRHATPLVMLLVAIAFAAFATESAFLVHHAARWGVRHV